MKGIIFNFIARIFGLARFFFFQKIQVYSNDNQNKLLFSYPTACVANHVSELDVISMLFVNRFTQTKSNYTVPTRQDMLEKNFLQKEFGLKGFLGFVLRVIDKTNIIPFLLSFLNAIPVKRPFRDNAKELVKSGNLKNLIEENWRTIAKHIQDGKNIFLFPEGTYTYNGFVNSPRKGIYLLKEYVPELKVINVSLSYDSLSFRKMDLHLTLGKMEIFPTELSKENISDFIRDKIAKDIVITHGNLVSFLFFQNIFREGILLQNWKELLDCFILKLRKEKDFFISKRFDSPNSSQIANRILEDARQSGFLVYKENKIYSTEKLLEKPETLNTEFLKKNPYLYHKNQLNYHWTKLTEIYSNCLEKILT